MIALPSGVRVYLACGVTDMRKGSALDLDAQEASWRESGWTGYDTMARGAASTAPVSAMDTTASATPTGGDDTIKVVQEQLVVGKREVERGRVKVRAYVIERPVEEAVRLHEETVHIERRPVDRAATAADLGAFQERTIEAVATREEAVVSKETRVVEEIGIRKDVSDREETVRDTVRETKVDVEDAAGASRTGGVTSETGAGAGTAAVTGVGHAIDRTLNTNVSSTNPSADAPDGTPGNPPGTMASRAVDKTLGTNSLIGARDVEGLIRRSCRLPGERA